MALKDVIENIKSGEPVDSDALEGAKIEGEVLPCADLRGASLDGARFVACDLTEGLFERAQLQEATFEQCRLTGANLGHVVAAQATFKDCNLEDALFLEADLFQARFLGCRLQGARFTSAGAVNVDFDDTICSGAGFADADLSFSSAIRSDFSHANLKRANLSGAAFQDVDLSGAELFDARLDGFELVGAQSAFDRCSCARTIRDVLAVLKAEVSYRFAGGLCGSVFRLEGGAQRSEPDVFREARHIEEALRTLRVAFRVASADAFEDLWQLATLSIDKGYVVVAPVSTPPAGADGAALSQARWVVLYDRDERGVTARTPFSAAAVLSREDLDVGISRRPRDDAFVALVIARQQMNVDACLTEALAGGARRTGQDSLPLLKRIQDGLSHAPQDVPADRLIDLCSGSVDAHRRRKEDAVAFLEEVLSMTRGARRDAVAAAAACFRSEAAGLAHLARLLPRYISPYEGEMRGRAFEILREHNERAAALLAEIVAEETAACEHLSTASGDDGCPS